MQTTKLPLLLVLIASLGCATYESSLQSGRVLTPGAASHGLGVYYSAPHGGMSYHYRRGIHQGVEGSLSVSPSAASVGLGWNLINQARFAFSLNPKILVPTAGLTHRQGYQGGLLLPLSYELLPTLSAVVTPAFYHKPWEPEAVTTMALHNGLLFGKEEGLFFEWSYYQQYFREGRVNNRQQLKIGVLTGLDGLDRPSLYWAEATLPSVHPSIGYEAPLSVQLGVFVQVPQLKWLVDEFWLSGSIPASELSREGQLLLQRSRFIGVKTSVPSGLDRDLRFSLGFAHRSLHAEIISNTRPQTLQVAVPVLSAGWRYDLPGVNLHFLEVLYPLPQLYRLSEGETSGTGQLAQELGEAPTVFLLQVELGK